MKGGIGLRRKLFDGDRYYKSYVILLRLLGENTLKNQLIPNKRFRYYNL